MFRPMLDRAYPDRNTDCQLALEVHLQALLDKAMAAGWKRKEATSAVINLAINFLVADTENDRSSLSVAQALGRVQH